MAVTVETSIPDARPEDAIFITGSLFLVAEARAMLVL